MTPLDLYRDMHNRPDWQEEAVCAQVDGNAWYPDKGESPAAAKRICLACPVKAECLAYALDRNERFGVWGGLSERERRRLVRGESVKPDRDARKALTAEQEARALALLSAGWLPPRIAEQFGVNANVIRRLRARLAMNGEAA